jgi:tetratricopeptide (TPR) repeat protein
VTWARDAVARWFPSLERRPHFVEALGRERRGDADASSALRALAGEAQAPAIARATALERLGRYPSEKNLVALRTALGSNEPLVVYGAVLGATELPLRERAALLLGAVEHPRRAVRIAAAKALAALRLPELSTNHRRALERAFAEVEQSFDVGASRAEAHVERSAFELSRGEIALAERSIRAALRLEPCLVEAHLNQADLERQRGNEAAAENPIRAALACDPESPAAHHALGLWQIRARRPDAALASLKNAVKLAPTNPRFAYVLAVALAGRGERDEAIHVLDELLREHPNDTDALQALATYLRETGQGERAAGAARRLDVLLRQ